jgi:lipopolysaccharide export system permease protein
MAPVGSIGLRLLPLRIMERYVLRQVTAPLLTAMFVGLLILVAERLVIVLAETMGKKNSFSIVFELISYWLPHYAGLAGPVALYFGLLVGFSRLSRSSELDALLASGLGLHQLARPLVILAAVMCAFSVLMFGWLQPFALYAYRALINTVENVDVFYLAEEGVFMQAGKRTFMLDKLQRGDAAFERIFLFDNRGNAGAETITAIRGTLVQLPETGRPVLRLENGNRLEIAKMPDLTGSAPLPPPTVGSFNTADTPLGSNDPVTFRPRGQSNRELTLTELATKLFTDPRATKINEARGEFHKRMVIAATILVLPFLALPFAIGSRRNPRAWRFVIAAVLLGVFYETIEQGAVATALTGVSPILTLWLPFVALVAFAGWRFWNAAFRLKRDRLEPVVQSLTAFTGGMWRRLAPAGLPQ